MLREVLSDLAKQYLFGMLKEYWPALVQILPGGEWIHQLVFAIRSIRWNSKSNGEPTQISRNER
ncbi:hypothetical protein FUAX_42190 (plasmid) [Fulvitalea axinellae]|uniref:Uncharacterized protein n=1 Tax=Fulvitalea axinellae TaxID=1182444 RepID=A0AAU9CUX2_9BACT|nr:hypothetical protein FUAX_42190 [Fulvitalea axinellae]